MLIAIVAICFIGLFTLPFLPGILEMIKKEDAEPLYISMDYVRSPRYFGKSFRNLLQEAAAYEPFRQGMQHVELSKNETLLWTPSIRFPKNMKIDSLLYVAGDLVSDSGVCFDKEVYVTGNTAIGLNGVLQAMAGDGDVLLADGVLFRRWLDAEGNIEIGAKSRLGISVSPENVLHLGPDCVFRRLFGMPIFTGSAVLAAANGIPAAPRHMDLSSNGLPFIRVQETGIPPGTSFDGDVVFLNDVHIGNDACFKGNIKSYGRLEFEGDATVEGNIFSEGDIIIGRRAKIFGHIFSQDSIRISEQTIISRPNAIKSVVGKKSIFIKPDVTIYGFVTTEGEGRSL
jgi:cytoskeletal protein CcmA (bactofilin family)